MFTFLIKLASSLVTSTFILVLVFFATSVMASSKDIPYSHKLDKKYRKGFFISYEFLTGIQQSEITLTYDEDEGIASFVDSNIDDSIAGRTSETYFPVSCIHTKIGGGVNNHLLIYVPLIGGCIGTNTGGASFFELMSIYPFGFGNVGMTYFFSDTQPSNFIDFQLLFFTKGLSYNVRKVNYTSEQARERELRNDNEVFDSELFLPGGFAFGFGREFESKLRMSIILRFTTGQAFRLLSRSGRTETSTSIYYSIGKAFY